MHRSMIIFGLTDFSRSYFTRDALDKSLIDDTISARNTSNGYNLLDFNTHVNPIQGY